MTTHTISSVDKEVMMILKYGWRILWRPQLIVGGTKPADFHDLLLVQQVYIAAKFEATKQSLMGKYSQHLPWPIWGPKDSLSMLSQITI